MEGETDEKVKVECTECPFSTIVADGGEKAGEVIIEHGRETNHTLTSEKVEEE